VVILDLIGPLSKPKHRVGARDRLWELFDRGRDPPARKIDSALTRKSLATRASPSDVGPG